MNFLINIDIGIWKFWSLYLKETPNSITSQHLCVIRIPNRDRIFQALSEKGIETGVHYKPSTWYPMYKKYDRGDLVNTEQAYKEILSLPLHLGLTDDDVFKVCSVIKEFYAS